MVTDAPQSSPALSRLPACILVFLIVFAAPVTAQERFRVTSDVSFRKAGNGAVLGTLVRGQEITIRKADGNWVEFRLEGWMFNRSVARTNREGFDVLTRTRENLRVEPNGRILARVSSGALFDRTDERTGWTRLRRDVWIPRSAIQSLTNPPATAQRPQPRDSARGSAAARDAGGSPSGAGAGLIPPASPGDYLEAAASTRILVTPDGPAVGALERGARARVVSRNGDWVRVQVDGWVKESETRPASDSGALTGVTAAEVRASPGRYVGKVVDWRVQFLAVQKADELRPEIPAGRHYLLTRGPLPESGFVYIIIPPDQVERFRAVTPLEEMMVRGTIKAASTRYLPNPVMELLSVGQL
jgi:hypothetical protein